MHLGKHLKDFQVCGDAALRAVSPQLACLTRESYIGIMRFYVFHLVRYFSIRAGSVLIYLYLVFVLIITGVTIRELEKDSSRLRSQQKAALESQARHNQQFTSLQNQEASVSAMLAEVMSRDEYQINQKLQTEVSEIVSLYTWSIKLYDSIQKLEGVAQEEREKLDNLYTSSILKLVHREYDSAKERMDDLDKSVKTIEVQLASSQAPPVAVNIPSSNQPPSSGYSRQKVSTSVGDFQIDIIAADLASTRVVVETASSSTCTNDCPVLSLADYVARSSAYAGINGSYFCPASYPSCQGKANSFDTLLMNKDKTYFNSDNNVYSSVPAVIFGGGWVRFVSKSMDWGRDTGIDSMLANHPLLVHDGQVTFGGDGDPKKGSRGSRSFVASKGNMVFIGVVRGATVAETAIVLSTLGMDHGLNLDSGGSTALWFGGYKAGPGRNIPNAILFVNK